MEVTRAVPYSIMLRRLKETIQKNISEQDPKKRISLQQFKSSFGGKYCKSGLFRWVPLRDKEFSSFLFDITELIVLCQYRNITFIAYLLEFACEIYHEVGVHKVLRSFVESQSQKRIFELGECHLVTLSAGQSELESNKFQKLLTTPYNSAHLCVDQHFDVVVNAVTSGNIGLLGVLLRFGVSMRKFEDNEFEFSYMKMVLYHLYCCIEKSMALDVLQLEHFETCFEENLRLLTPTSRRRFFFLSLALEILIRILDCKEDVEFYVHGLGLLFRSIPESVVTIGEIKESLHRVGFPSKCIHTVCREFDRYIGGDSGLPQPRTLKHLSRCQVRDNLRARGSCLPNEVDDLPLPETLKNYIHLKEDDSNNHTTVMCATRPNLYVKIISQYCTEID